MINAADSDSKEAMKRAGINLDKGAKVLTIRQKHIKIADGFHLSWANVKHYISDSWLMGLRMRKR